MMHTFVQRELQNINYNAGKTVKMAYDTWHMKNGVRQEFQKIVSKSQDGNKASLTVAINWLSKDEVLLSEERQFIFHKPNDKGAYLIDKVSNITAVKGDAELAGDREHAGCQFRANEAVVGNKSANYLFASGKIDEKA